MTYQTATDIVDTLSESKQREKVGIVIQLAIEYARLRVDHLIAPPDRQAQLGQQRSQTHNALIRAINELAEAMESAHENTLWRETMGQDRKDIGDFACCVHCILGIEAR
jgi:hypothetical protein